MSDFQFGQTVNDFVMLPDGPIKTFQELAGERVFFGKGRCSECHMPQTSFLDNNIFPPPA